MLKPVIGPSVARWHVWWLQACFPCGSALRALEFRTGRYCLEITTLDQPLPIVEYRSPEPLCHLAILQLPNELSPLQGLAKVCAHALGLLRCIRAEDKWRGAELFCFAHKPHCQVTSGSSLVWPRKLPSMSKTFVHVSTQSFLFRPKLEF